MLSVSFEELIPNATDTMSMSVSACLEEEVELGFSIRDYTQKMRSVDISKCWPFDDDDDDDHMTITKEDAEAFLPPITVPKFRWWSHELQSSFFQEDHADDGVSDDKNVDKPEKFGVVCPVCLVFSAATVKAVNAHVGRCLVRKERRRQVRAPKKRSVAEIFAETPQVVRVDDDGSNVKIKKKKKKKKKKKSKLDHETLAVNILSGLKKKKKVVNKDGQKKECDSDTDTADAIDLLFRAIAKKDRSHKLRLQSSVSFTGKSYSSSYIEGLAKDVLDAGLVQKEKRNLKCLKAQKKIKHARTAKSITKHRKSASSVHGILKNQTKVGSEWNPTICNLTNARPMTNCFQQSNRPLRFSGDADTLGPRKEPFRSPECSELQNVSSLCSNWVDASSKADYSAEGWKNLDNVKVNGSGTNISCSTVNDSDFLHVNEKQSFDECLAGNNRLYQWRHGSDQKYWFDRSVGLYQEQGPLAELDDPLPACIPRQFCMKECYNPLVNQVGRNALITSDASREVFGYSGDLSHQSTESMDYVNAFPRGSSSLFVKSTGDLHSRLPFPSHSTTENSNGQALQYQPFVHFSPKELMRMCSLPLWNQSGIGKEVMDEGYLGLPLNSQGELIQSNSDCTCEINKLMLPHSCGLNHLKGANTVTNSYSGLALHNNKLTTGTTEYSNFKIFNERAAPANPSKFSPFQDSVTENPYYRVSSRLGIAESQTTGRTDVPFFHYTREDNHPLRPRELDLDSMDICDLGCDQFTQVRNHTEYGNMHPHGYPDLMSPNVTQPTMRLMGKEFTVDRKNKDLGGFEDGMIWNDKNIIMEHFPPNTATNDSTVRSQFQPDLIMRPAPCKVKGPATCSSEIQMNQALNASKMNHLESMFSQPYIGYQTDVVYEEGHSASNVNSCTASHSHICPAASPVLYDREPVFQEYSVCGLSNDQIPAPESTFHNSCQQKLPHSVKSAFKFPFLRPDSIEHVQPSWCQSSFKSLPPWFFSAGRQNEISLGSCMSYSDVRGSEHPGTTSGNTCITIPSLCHTPNVSHLFNPLSLYPLQNSLGQASYYQHLPAPIHPGEPGIVPTPYINNRRSRIRFKDRVKWRACTKNPVQRKRTGKRLPAESEYPAKLSKLPNLCVQEDSSCSMTAPKASIKYGGSNNMQEKAVELELEQREEEANRLRIAVERDECQRDEPRSYAGIDPFQFDGVARAGPVRLAAGDKHILELSQSMDQSNSRLTHSSTPFAAANTFGRVSEFQRKSAKIYKF